MRELLDSSTKRRLEILEQLNTTADWISSNQLAKDNQASLRTINSDVQFLREEWFPHLIIETSKKNGVRLNTPPSSHAYVVYQDVFQNSDAFQLLENIFFQPNYSLEDWEDELFISESSLYRIVQQLRDSLARWAGIDVKRNPCHVSNLAERKARYFFACFFNEVHGIHEWLFLSNQKRVVELVEFLYNYYGYAVDEVQISYVAYIVAVSIERYQQGFYLPNTCTDPFISQHEKVIEAATPLIRNIVLPLNMIVDQAFIADLLATIFFINHPAQSETATIKDQLNTFIQSIEKQLDLTLTEKNRTEIVNVLFLIYCQQLVYPHNDYILFNQFEFNGSALKVDYPQFTSVIQAGLTTLEKNMNFPWCSHFNNEVLYWIMVKWENLPTLLEQKKAKAKLLIISSLGQAHAELLAEMIEKNFGHKVSIDVYHGSAIFLENIDPKEFDGYDYFITTFFKDIIPEDRVIVVDAIPSNQDWSKLRKAINTIHKIKPFNNH